MSEGKQTNVSTEIKWPAFNEVEERDRDLEFGNLALVCAASGTLTAAIFWGLFFYFAPVMQKFELLAFVLLFSSVIGVVAGRGVYLYEDDSFIRTLCGIAAATYSQIFLTLFSTVLLIGFNWLSIELPKSSPSARYALAFFIVPTISAILFLIRKHRRIFYGISESFSGLMIVAYKTVLEQKSDLLEPNYMIAMLTAGVYLMVRGFDNIDVGLKERRIRKQSQFVGSKTQPEAKKT